MFANCCQLCGCENLQVFLDYLGPLKPHVENYINNCPFACYTGYALLSLAVLFFFVLWRRAIGAWKVEAHAVALLVKTKSSPICCSMPAPTTCTTDTADVLATIERIQYHALETVHKVQTDALHQLATAHSDSLIQIEKIVDSFNATEVHEQ